MRAVGYAVLLAGLVGGGIFLLNLLSGLARDQCRRNCPRDPHAVHTVFAIGPARYQECRCPVPIER